MFIEAIQYSQTCRKNLGVTSLFCELKKKTCFE